MAYISKNFTKRERLKLAPFDRIFYVFGLGPGAKLGPYFPAQSSGTVFNFLGTSQGFLARTIRIPAAPQIPQKIGKTLCFNAMLATSCQKGAEKKK